MDIISYLYDMKKGIIYRYTSPSGKHYIGKTTNPKVRKREHLCNSKVLVTKFYSAIKKYGFESFEYEVLFESTLLPIDELNTLLNEKEKHFIQMFNSFNNGYNLTLGGDGQVGFKHKSETIEFYKKTRKNPPKEQRDKMSITATNRRLSIETKEKIRLGNIGKGMSDTNKQLVSQQKSKPIIQYDLKGNFIKEWKSATEAAKTLGLNNKAISKVCKRNKGTVYENIWKFK